MVSEGVPRYTALLVEVWEWTLIYIYSACKRSPRVKVSLKAGEKQGS